MVLPIIYKSGPDQALVMARAVADPSDQAHALAIVADLMPLSKAAPLYQEAETKSVDQRGQGYTPACIAAHAWLRDKTLGKLLFQQAYDKVIKGPAKDIYGQGPSYAEFAFYSSKIDPAFSRLLKEKLYDADKN